METGDLIYVILLLLFMILGFFNDSRKKKEQKKQQQEPNPNFSANNQEINRTVPPPFSDEQQGRYELEKERKLRQLKREKEKFAREGEVVFKSSMDLRTDFNKESSLKGTIYTNDTGSLYDQEIEAADTYDEEPDTPEMANVLDDTRYAIHPLVEDLLGVNRSRELVKGLIYGEILKKKY